MNAVFEMQTDADWIQETKKTIKKTIVKKTVILKFSLVKYQDIITLKI